MKKVTALLAILVALVGLGPFLVPIPSYQGLQPAKVFAEENSRFVELNGLEVHYQTAGNHGNALVLLHGFGASLFSWRDVIAPLAHPSSEKNRLVVAFDRPAFGLTERPLSWEGENPYSPEAQVKLTIALMDHLGIQQAVLVGNSAGGALSMQVALDYPNRVQALILVDPAVYTAGGTPAWVKPLLNTPQGRRLGLLFIQRIQTWGQDFLRNAWHNPARITPQIQEGYTRPLQVENWDRALLEFTLASRQLDILQRLDELDLPTLVITGDDDRIVPTEESIRLADELPNARLAVIPNCGHLPQEECPEPFLAATEEFLAEIEKLSSLE